MIKEAIACEYRPLAQAEQPSFGGGQNKVIGLPLVEVARLASLNWSDS